MPKYFTIDEYAKAANHHPRYIRELISTKKLASEMISSRRLLPDCETNMSYLQERKRLAQVESATLPEPQQPIAA